MDDRFLNANEQTKKFVLSFWTKGFSEIVFPAINEDGANFMGIIYQTNKKTGITYAYQNESYWDKEKKQSREKRKLLGKVDPVTGDIISTRSYKTKEHKAESAPAKLGPVAITRYHR